MIRTLFRKGAADLRTRRLQTALLFIVVASASAILMLAISIEQSVTSSYDRAHDEAHGAHVWFNIDNESAARSIAGLAGVVESTDAADHVFGKLIGLGEPDPVVFTGLGAVLEGITPATIIEGRWLESGAGGEIVITRDIGRESALKVGDSVQAITANASAELTVVGITIDTSHSPYPESKLGVVFVSEATVQDLTGGPLEGLTPAQLAERRAGFTVGVRIERPDDANEFAADVERRFGSVLYSTSWIQIRETVKVMNEAPVIIIRIFSFFGLLAAGIIVASAITGHVMALARDVGVLKASGFSPWHVTLLFLGQQLALGLVAAVVGVVLAVVATPYILRTFGELLYSGVSSEVDPLAIATVIVGVGLVVVVFTLIPSWRAGRTSTVAALSNRYRQTAVRPSGLAGLAKWLHLPHIVAFGMKDVFIRKSRAWLSIAAVSVVAAIVMMTLTLFEMLDRLENDPTSMGAWPFDLSVERLDGFGTADAANGVFIAGVRDPITHGEMVTLAEARDEVESLMTIWETTARVEELDAWFQNFIINGPVGEFDFRVTDGRMFTDPNETVIGLGLAQTYDLGIGDRLTVMLRLNEARTEEVPLTIVGVFEANLGRVLMFGDHTLHDLGILSESDDPIGNLGLKLGRSVDADKFARTLVSETGERVAVTNIVQGYQDSLDDELALKPLLLALSGVLIGLAVTNLVIALLFSVRERTREFGIMKTVGFTPWQIVFTVVLGAAVLAVIGVVIGAPIGYFLTRFWMLHLADTDGLPSDLVRLPSLPWLAFLALLTAGLAALGSALPARHAAVVTVSQALRFE